MKGCEIEIESLSAYRAVDKLRGAGIRVLSAVKTAKNGVRVTVDGKDRKKVFAIFRGSCYNIKNVRFRGAARLFRGFGKRIGLLAGIAVVLPALFLAEGRVLRIDVRGSGAYYEREVRDILARNGVTFFSPMPANDAALSAEILSLPRVGFCSVKSEGGVLTVTVEVSDEDAFASGEPLRAPVGGVVEELVVIRGTPLVSVGDEVRQGDVVAAGYARIGERERPVLVIARVRIAYPVAKEYALAEREALDAAFLDFGELTQVHTTETENGWLVEGTAHGDASVNFD